MLITYHDISNSIMEIIAEYFEQPLENIITKSRKREYIIPRQFIHFFLKEKTDLSLQSIGNITQKHHATVIHSIKTITNLIEVDKEMIKYYTELKKLIG
jgi:chromosomal replication initiator protein